MAKKATTTKTAPKTTTPETKTPKQTTETKLKDGAILVSIKTGKKFVFLGNKPNNNIRVATIDNYKKIMDKRTSILKENPNTLNISLVQLCNIKKDLVTVPKSDFVTVTQYEDKLASNKTVMTKLSDLDKQIETSQNDIAKAENNIRMLQQKRHEINQSLFA